MKIKFFILIVILLSFSQVQAAQKNDQNQNFETREVAKVCLDAAGSWTDAVLHPEQCIGAVYGELKKTDPANADDTTLIEYAELEEQSSSL